MTQTNQQVAVRAMYMRGGTSKGVFFTPDDLPAAARTDIAARDRFMSRVMGSPDPYGKQIDGMGAATSSTSKVVLVGKSTRPDCDVDYLFGAVAIEDPVVDWSGNCGNLSSAVGPYAIHRGLVDAPRDGIAVIRIWQANIKQRIIAYVPMRDGQVDELGEFELDGVAFPAAEIKLEFLDPGAGKDDGAAGAMFPTGNRVDMLNVPGVGSFEATLINAGNPAIFVRAQALGLSGAELQDDINGDTALLRRLEAIRAHGTVAMGLAATAEEATATRPHTPKLAFVAPPSPYTAASGKAVQAGDINMLARIMSMGKLHHAMTGTGAVAIAVAAAIPDTVVSRTLGGGSHPRLVFGHPSGRLSVGAEAIERDGGWKVTKAIMSRSARRLMDGQVFVPIE
ncbi:2-methylaconitate cis-trans isomerase PrpF [Candidimonas nitroreducens]|uniref:2-methylaconitate cis-trans isomerase PrpF n=1 Tax=Candidimonas nitroreducens TaxID=683354 RepID=A0A225LYK2_9BURK|nr:2-methylaconitate cis-trans isomerase PrpF [Candidimonas nitroreducens]OWT54198.1 2-methylaconitate cis-trans isomerase PrpF [Candidimonas nitroreducens]